MNAAVALHRAQFSKAYTLAEMLVVVTVLGLAGAMLVPSIAEPDTLRIQGVVRLVIADLSFAQSDALAQQELRRVHFYADGSGYVILREPYDPMTDYIFDPLAPAGGSGAYIVNFVENDRYQGISVSGVDIDAGNRYITFDELGGTITAGNAPGTGGFIEIQSEHATYRINIAPFTGKLTVVEL